MKKKKKKKKNYMANVLKSLKTKKKKKKHFQSLKIIIIEQAWNSYSIMVGQWFAI